MIKVAELDELKSGAIKRITTNGEALVLCNVDGEYFAVKDLCTHEDFPLSYGCLKGHSIECSLHGARFDVRTGEPTAEPGEDAIKTYPVVIHENAVYLDQ
ncbi:non-heme iron oxygenase ferredoxin subunit [Leucothrix sargassi]|nr:non-heme iron oxygenase ferredoxin subunit [Leucothrix sargassi]